MHPGHKCPYAYGASKYAAFTFTYAPSSSSISPPTNASSWYAFTIANTFLTSDSNAGSNGNARSNKPDGPSDATRTFYGNESKWWPSSWGFSEWYAKYARPIKWNWGPNISTRGPFNRPQGGQMPMMQGYNPY